MLARIMLGRLWLAQKAIGRTLRARLPLLAGGGALLTLRALTAAGRLIDTVCYPGLRSQRIERPIVLVGCPRTGSTFLQRFLVAHGVGAGMPLWRMLFPSLVLQRLVGPLLPLLERINPARDREAAAHETSLRSVETDDAALYLHFFDGFFLYAFLLAFADDELRNLVDPARRDTSARDFEYLERLWRGNLIATGRERVVAKLFSASARLPQFQARYPDAKILFMARDPVEMIPSALSLATGVLERRFGFWRLPEALRTRYIEHLYAALLLLMRRFHDDWTCGRIIRDNVFIVPYPRIVEDFSDLIHEVLGFLEVEVDSTLRRAIERQAQVQRHRRSGHVYSLERFGLSAEQVRRDFAFYYKTFFGGESVAVLPQSAPSP